MAIRDAEQAGLEAARYLVTPHSLIADIAGDRAIKLDWQLPQSNGRSSRGRMLAFPASTLARKGCYEMREMARRLNMRRSIINRQLSGEQDLTLRSLADLAWALDREITFELRQPRKSPGQNIGPATSTTGYSPIKVIAPPSSND